MVMSHCMGYRSPQAGAGGGCDKLRRREKSNKDREVRCYLHSIAPFIDI